MENPGHVLKPSGLTESETSDRQKRIERYLGQLSDMMTQMIAKGLMDRSPAS